MDLILLDRRVPDVFCDADRVKTRPRRCQGPGDA